MLSGAVLSALVLGSFAGAMLAPRVWRESRELHGRRFTIWHLATGRRSWRLIHASRRARS